MIIQYLVKIIFLIYTYQWMYEILNLLINLFFNYYGKFYIKIVDFENIISAKDFYFSLTFVILFIMFIYFNILSQLLTAKFNNFSSLLQM